VLNLLDALDSIRLALLDPFRAVSDHYTEQVLESKESVLEEEKDENDSDLVIFVNQIPRFYGDTDLGCCEGDKRQVVHVVEHVGPDADVKHHLRLISLLILVHLRQLNEGSQQQDHKGKEWARWEQYSEAHHPHVNGKQLNVLFKEVTGHLGEHELHLSGFVLLLVCFSVVVFTIGHEVEIHLPLVVLQFPIELDSWGDDVLDLVDDGPKADKHGELERGLTILLLDEDVPEDAEVAVEDRQEDLLYVDAVLVVADEAVIFKDGQCFCAILVHFLQLSRGEYVTDDDDVLGDKVVVLSTQLF